MILNELLKSTYAWEEHEYDEDRFVYSFTTMPNYQRVLVKFINDVHAYNGDLEGLYWIEFSRNGEFKVTNEGDAYKIFATVLEIIDAFIRTHHPMILAFTSEGFSRTSLYKRMFKSAAQKYSADYVPLETAKFAGTYGETFSHRLKRYMFGDRDTPFGLVHKNLTTERAT